MNVRPNVLQKLIHQVGMLRPVTAFFAPRIHRIDKVILGLTRGKHTLTEILGWNVIELTTVGAKTGQPRTLPLIAVFEGETIGLIASSFGREHNPGWYYNLKKNPACEVKYRGQTSAYLAHEAQGHEYEKYWQLALSYYAGYEKYRERTNRTIPVMVLESCE